MPLDIDTFAMDQSGTAKEHVGCTYAGVDGYPAAGGPYLGTQGFCTGLPCAGHQHSASETEYNIERLLPLAAKSRQRPSRPCCWPTRALDSAKLMCTIARQASLQREVAWLIKWNRAARR